MNGQPIRWPGRVILGGHDTASAGSVRYLHFGPLAFSVDHEWDGSWTFRLGQYFGNPRWSVRFRLR